MADKANDPVAIWQTMIGEMEKGFNSFANQAMAPCLRFGSCGVRITTLPVAAPN